MATDFDAFPVYDPLIKAGTTKMADSWVAIMSSFYMNLIGYLTSGGILVPQLTSAQRDALQNVQNGQMIYNTTTAAPQIYQAGAWKTFTTS